MGLFRLRGAEVEYGSLFLAPSRQAGGGQVPALTTDAPLQALFTQHECPRRCEESRHANDVFRIVIVAFTPYWARALGQSEQTEKRCFPLLTSTSKVGCP